MGAGLRIQRPIQLQIQDALWFGLGVLHFRVLVERHDSQIKMFTEPLHMSLTLLICYGRLGLLKGDIAHCQTSFAFHS